MMASSVQGFGAANAGRSQINRNSITGIPKRGQDIVEHGIVEHCTDSARECQLVAGLSQTSRIGLCKVGLRRVVAETRGFLSNGGSAAGLPPTPRQPCATETEGPRRVTRRLDN